MKTTKRLILCDIDEIVLNWIDGFEKYLKDLGYKQIANLKEVYYVNLAYNLDIDPNILITRFNNSEDFANLSMVPNAVENINLLKEHDFSIFAITAVPNESKTYFNRIRNLEKHFGKSPFDGYCFVNADGEKYNILKNTQPNYFIEDNPRHISCALELGIKTTGLNLPYNNNLKGFYGKDNWEDITKQILEWESIT